MEKINTMKEISKFINLDKLNILSDDDKIELKQINIFNYDKYDIKVNISKNSFRKGTKYVNLNSYDGKFKLNKKHDCLFINCEFRNIKFVMNNCNNIQFHNCKFIDCKITNFGKKSKLVNCIINNCKLLNGDNIKIDNSIILNTIITKDCTVGIINTFINESIIHMQYKNMLHTENYLNKSLIILKEIFMLSNKNMYHKYEFEKIDDNQLVKIYQYALFKDFNDHFSELKNDKRYNTIKCRHIPHNTLDTGRFTIATKKFDDSELSSVNKEKYIRDIITTYGKIKIPDIKSFLNDNRSGILRISDNTSVYDSSFINTDDVYIKGDDIQFINCDFSNCKFNNLKSYINKFNNVKFINCNFNNFELYCGSIKIENCTIKNSLFDCDVRITNSIVLNSYFHYYDIRSSFCKNIYIRGLK